MTPDKIKEKIKEKQEYLKRVEQEYFVTLGQVKQLQELINDKKESK